MMADTPPRPGPPVCIAEYRDGTGVRPYWLVYDFTSPTVSIHPRLEVMSAFIPLLRQYDNVVRVR